jgi:hypothetical protein
LGLGIGGNVLFQIGNAAGLHVRQRTLAIAAGGGGVDDDFAGSGFADFDIGRARTCAGGGDAAERLVHPTVDLPVDLPLHGVVEHGNGIPGMGDRRGNKQDPSQRNKQAIHA